MEGNDSARERVVWNSRLFHNETGTRYDRRGQGFVLCVQALTEVAGKIRGTKGTKSAVLSSQGICVKKRHTRTCTCKGDSRFRRARKKFKCERNDLTKDSTQPS